MSTKPIFVATHPRACSTAFERVFMTRQDTLTCVHEPFGDAFYFGPERLSTRYADDAKAREESGFSNSTYQAVFERIERESKEGKRLFIKDITHYLMPPEGKLATIAPSLGGQRAKQGVGTNGATNGATNGHANRHPTAPYPYDTAAEPGNPTVVPAEILKQFHFTFLIRHPRHSIPSYYRCTIPPLDSVTGFYDFMPSEAGYGELRRLFDFLVREEQVGPAKAGEAGDGAAGGVSITVIDADDLLDEPEGIVAAYCKEVGITYTPEMLIWDTEEDHQRARDAFEKWRGFHDDAINSTSLKPRSAAHKKKTRTAAAEDEEWRERYGEEGARVIRACVQANLSDYEYLKSFAIKGLRKV
ncbi:hypothetical protein QTJ16_001092 [Diplocarpon rosae]|uniref:P-loop containing nucleoside triphosphate hydrolase protein n=1 Tax=Diplocarpon rosae TaxID=946125 RepID=A0AAD9WFX5_9HELO|nr:hypothetical protein QTJ16_001092 [Diplocarpon rosae]PBP28641.1 hypothetical protein BUE80_DR000245 [Diplocarpon rosae]